TLLGIGDEQLVPDGLDIERRKMCREIWIRERSGQLDWFEAAVEHFDVSALEVRGVKEGLLFELRQRQPLVDGGGGVIDNHFDRSVPVRRIPGVDRAILCNVDEVSRNLPRGAGEEELGGIVVHYDAGGMSLSPAVGRNRRDGSYRSPSGVEAHR